jgi:uncharacterized RDD family membrane protein YckC
MYATIHKRGIAILADTMIIYMFSIALNFLGIIDNKIFSIMVLAAFISWFYFFIFLLLFRGRTFGSRLTGIQVVGSDFTKLNIKRIMIRTILLTMLIAPVGVVLVVAIFNLAVSVITLNTLPWKLKRQTFWDFASDTCVIDVGKVSGVQGT